MSKPRPPTGRVSPATNASHLRGITRFTLPACRAQYPGGSNGCSCRLLRHPCCLPRFEGGSASASLPFEACSGFTHVAARWIAQPPKAAFVTRLQSGQSPSQTARQLPGQSTIPWVEPPSTGQTRLRGAPQNQRSAPLAAWRAFRFPFYPAVMPRHGSRTLSDLTSPRLVVACDKCGRRGSYSVERLWRQRGDLRLTEFLEELTATCPLAGAFALGDRCGARGGGHCYPRVYPGRYWFDFLAVTILGKCLIFRWCRKRGSNPRPSVYKTAALPLCYSGPRTPIPGVVAALTRVLT